MSDGRLPNLLIVGVPKAGTSSLFAYLAQHPDICAADKKELGYFNHYNRRRHPEGRPPPVETYMKHWSHCTGQRYAMEATPSYSYGGEPVIEGVRKILGQPRIIITLRDPVSRLWSAYTFQRSLGNIPRIKSFEEYLSVSEQRRQDGTDLDVDSHLHGLSIGFYADYLGHWLDAFGENAKVIFAEDVASDPARRVAEMFEWLGLDAGAITDMDLGARNVTRHARSPIVANVVYALKRAGDRYQVLPRALRGRLRQTYLRVNARGQLNERLDPSTRERVEDIYRVSTRMTADVLEARGYQDLPAWLRVGSDA